jgi:hypothetical protein
MMQIIILLLILKINPLLVAVLSYILKMCTKVIVQGQSVMEGLITEFRACGLYDFMGHRTNFSEIAVKQFIAIVEIDTEA